MVHAATTNSGQCRPVDDPRTGWFVYILASTATIGGFLFGYGTGIVSSAMLYIPNANGIKPMDSVWHEVIVSVTPGFAAIGSLCSGPSSDFLGRKKIILGASLIYTAGAVICAIAWSKIILVIGRILLGTAIGFASMIVPVYLGETSPSNIRGFLVTGFHLLVTIGMVISNLIGEVFSYINPDQIGWRLMFALAAVPSIIQFVCFIFLPESPRWLYEHERAEEAREVLDKIYNGHTEWVDYEMNEIRFSNEEEVRARKEHAGNGPTIIRVLKTPHVRKALFVGSILQCLQQLSGINAVMYYTSSLLKSAGVKSDHTTIWITVGISGINFVTTFIPMALIERLGRRLLLLLSMISVIITLLALGVSFLLMNNDSRPTFTQDAYTTNWNSSFANAVHCQRHSNCDYCVTDQNCGFCEDSVQKKGYCLPFPTDGSSSFSSTGMCASNYMSKNSTGLEWEDSYCHTKYNVLPIIIMLLFIFAFAAGYAPIPWVLAAEFFPLWARSTCVSITTASNWTFNLVVSLTFLSLSEAVTKFGTFFIYAGFTIINLIFVYFFVPETKGYSIDEVEMLFMTKTEREKAERVLEESKQKRESL